MRWGYGVMPDDENQAGASQGTAGNAQGDQSGQAPTQEDIDRLTAALTKERDANRRAQADLKSARLEIEKAGSAGKSDADKLAAEREAWQQRIEALTAKTRAAHGKDAVQQAAKSAGAPDADLIYRLVKSDIAYDDDSDEPSNVEELIAGCRKDFPDLFKTQPAKADSGGEGARGKPAKGTTMNDWIRQQAGR